MTTYNAQLHANPIKDLCPFRVGCTSYVFPDEIIPNVQAMASMVDDIELVLFETEEKANFPSPDQIKILKDLADEHALTYTVHFPIDKNPCSADTKERAYLLDQIERLLEITVSLNPFGYLLHLDTPGRNDEDPEGVWYTRASAFAAKVAAVCSDKAIQSRICVENLSYPIDWLDPIVEENGFSRCIDFGPMWLNRHEWHNATLQRLSQTRILHFHGVTPEKEHQPLDQGDVTRHQELLSILEEQQYQNVLTLEVFGRTATFASMKAFSDLWQKRHS